MRLLDWNSIENSRHGITVSIKGPSKFNPLLLSEIGGTLFEVGLVDYLIFYSVSIDSSSVSIDFGVSFIALG